MKKVFLFLMALIAMAVTVSANTKAPPTSQKSVEVKNLLYPECQQLVVTSQVIAVGLKADCALLLFQKSSDFMTMQKDGRSGQVFGLYILKQQSIVEGLLSGQKDVKVSVNTQSYDSLLVAGNLFREDSQNISGENSNIG